MCSSQLSEWVNAQGDRWMLALINAQAQALQLVFQNVRNNAQDRCHHHSLLHSHQALSQVPCQAQLQIKVSAQCTRAQQEIANQIVEIASIQVLAVAF